MGKILLMAWCILTCFQSIAGNYKISGDVEIKEGTILLIVERASGRDTIGRAPLHDGKFVLEGTVAQPEVALIAVEGYEGGFLFFLDSDAPYTMVLRQNFSEIKGGKLQTAYTDYQALVASLNKELQELKGKIEEESKARHFRTVSELNKQLDELTQKNAKRIDEFIQLNKENLLGVYISCLTARNTGNVEVMEKVYSDLSESVKQLTPATLLAKQISILKSLQVGQEAPDFVLQDVNGKEVRLSDIKGKIKLLDFWASWCGPCRLENPNMVKLYNDYKDKGLAIVSVSLDTDKAKWLKAIEADGLPWVHVSSLKGWKCEVVKRYEVDAVPYIWVLDENNRILGKQMRGEVLRAFVSEKLN